MGNSRSNSSWMGPTTCSSTFSKLTMPETVPYSSTTIATCVRFFWNSRSSTSSCMVSGKKGILRLRSVKLVMDLPACSSVRTSLACTMPTTRSRSPSQRGNRVYCDSAIRARFSAIERRALRNTMSRRGTMTCRVTLSSRSSTFSIIRRSRRVTSPPAADSERMSRSSSSECSCSWVSATRTPSRARMKLLEACSIQMNGQRSL